MEEFQAGLGYKKLSQVLENHTAQCCSLHHPEILAALGGAFFSRDREDDGRTEENLLESATDLRLGEESPPSRTKHPKQKARAVRTGLRLVYKLNPAENLRKVLLTDARL